MSLVELKKLTVRFGGLTAVSGVDCRLDEHQIVSIIGPNGAGKTTLFNAVTGIYEPTSGSVQFAGRPLARPWNWRIAVAALAIGLSTALAGFLATANVDRLWQATIKRNYSGPGEPFSYRAAWHGAKDYLAGRLQVATPGEGRWSVVTADGRRTLAYADSLAEAEKTRDRLATLIDWLVNDSRLGISQLVSYRDKDGSIYYLEPRDVDPSVDARQDALVHYPSEVAAATGLESLLSVGRENAARRRNAWLALVVGLLLGTAGPLVVWNRSRRTPDYIARTGIARTFQNIRLFQNMTVLENVLTGMERRFRAGFWRMALRTPAVRREEAAAAQQAQEWLRFVGLQAKANSLAKNLAYGEQRRLEIARALATEPRVLLLDEPAAGMNPAESAQVATLIDSLRRHGLSVLLIEHHMRVVMGISDRIVVLDHGSKIAEGTPAEVRANPAVIAAYLGGEEIT